MLIYDKLELIAPYSEGLSHPKITYYKFRLTYYIPCCLSIPPENIRKPLGFLMYSVGKDKQHRPVLG